VEEFKKQGLGVGAIMYDSQEILADFSARKKITFPMLSDPGSNVIKAFGVLNTFVPAGDMQYGIPFPGTFIVDHNGVVISKYFESQYQDRYSAPTILAREFGSPAGTRETSVKTAHLEMKSYVTRDVVRPNLRFTVVANIELKPKMHVYAPGVADFIPIEFQIDPSSNFKTKPVIFPKPEKKYLAPIKQTVQVYEGKFQVTQDINMAANDVLQPILSGSKELKITGRLRYQACDDSICYLPQNVPLEWIVKVDPLDRDRVPEPIQHKAAAAK